jgi:hypothetical protein
VSDSGARWVSWLAVGGMIVGLVCGPFAVCGLCTAVSTLLDVWKEYENRPEWQHLAQPYFDLVRTYWRAGLVCAIVLLVLVVVVGTALRFRDYVRWAPKGLVSWVRWLGLPPECRSKLDGLGAPPKGILVGAVRVGKPWQGGRLSVETSGVETYLQLRSRVRIGVWCGRWMVNGLEELRRAGLLTFGQQEPGVFLLSLSRDYGPPARLAGLLDAQLVKQRVWKP